LFLSLIMSIVIEPLVNEPAVRVENTIRVLVLADLHLGIEWDIHNNSGIVIPSQSDKGLTRVLQYIDTIKPDRVVLLGDIKHNIPWISWQEREEIPYFLDRISQNASVDIVPGNHDGDMEQLINLMPDPSHITLRPVKGFVLDNVGYFHGHTWPALELLSCKHILMAHNHPTIRFTDTLGHSSAEPAWIRTSMDHQPLEEHYRINKTQMQWSDPEVIIIPAFCELCGGAAFNESFHEDLLGPVFSSKAINLDKGEAYLLDGTRLGTLNELRKINRHDR